MFTFCSRNVFLALQKSRSCLIQMPSFVNSSVNWRCLSSNTVKMLEVAPNRKVAYDLYEGTKIEPTVVFVPGFMSTMEGFKAKKLEKFCKEKDQRFVRFDFEAIGKSPGKFSDICVGNWIEDLKCVIQNLVPGKVLLVGSSMGGWFSLKVGMELKERVHSMILVAPAINFFKYYYDFFYKDLTPEQRSVLDSGKVLILKKNYGDIFLRKDLMEESLKHHVDLDKPITINSPIRILHGFLDPDVPFKQSLQIMKALTSVDVDVTFRKDGKHQMSEEADLELLTQTLATLLQQPPSKL